MTTIKKWQTRDEMPFPTNPLQKLHEVLAFSSKDMSINKCDSFLYGIIVGWDENAYKELKIIHNWSSDEVELQKKWHEKYNELWNKFFE
jgi:hypothetical protein